MPGDDYVLGGPVFWLATGLLLAAGALAAFVVFDCVRRARAVRADDAGPDAGRVATPLRWWYLAPQAVYLVLVVLGQFRIVPVVVTGITVFATPVLIGQGVFYLLRVVFPKGVSDEADDGPDSRHEDA
ncbi:MAG: hypothetical protein HGB10_06785 [Coriobacteriia bacterium]|nr:hypothetical protein [Coriobacteriia bacterium]